jgi:sugar lactone lactonase YvrE
MYRFVAGKYVMGTIAAAVCAMASLSAQPAVTVVMSGLDNPRGLAIGPEGALYVAEAGRGGPGPCGLNSPGETRCYGPTGAVSRLWRGEQERIATGLPSHALPDGSGAGGPNDISFQGRGGAFIPFALGNDQRLRDALAGAGPFFGTLVKMSASGQWRVVADLLAHEATANPGGGAVDSNPYGVLAEAGRQLVTDAGGNSLLAVYENGQIETVATFPSRAQGRATDAVPTAIVRGPDGAYYVSELSGIPFAAGAAQIYRLVPGQAPQVVLTGFKTITDLAFDSDGNLFVVEHASGAVFFAGPGRLLRVAPDGTRTVVLGDLDRPTSVVIGWDGEIYVTNHGITAGAGEVLRIDQ